MSAYSYKRTFSRLVNYVCFTPKADITEDYDQCPVLTQSGHFNALDIRSNPGLEATYTELQ